MTDDYLTFLSGKRLLAQPSGFTVAPDALPDRPFAFQRDGILWALQQGKAALFYDTGLGKTTMEACWAQQVARHTGGRVLILAPLAVAHQTIAEAATMAIPIAYAGSQAEAEVYYDTPICITNYDRVDRFSGAAWAGVVLDECFAPDTLIDMPAGHRAIKDIRVGDQILNAAGVDTVSDVHRREVSYAVRVVINGRAIISSPNHPYFTQRGWVGAQDLTPGDYALATNAAMRLVRGNVCPEISQSETSAILRDILFSEMANASARVSRESTYARSGGEARQEKGGMVQVGIASSGNRNGTHSITQSDEQSRNAPEGIPPIERDAARTFRAWGQWSGVDEAAAIIDGCTWERLDSGVCFVTGSTKGRVSNALQARRSQSRAENSYRGGWSLASQPQASGQEERRDAAFARVDSLEVLELGHPDLDRYRDASGSLYFYDLGGTRHPSFSINGCLVHNSSILKSYTGKTKQALLSKFHSTPYRLAATATPSPNDLIELGNHAEFLGLMPSNEMLMRWFINDTMKAGGYRLKGHAEADYWNWVASWAACVSKPSDLGYSDAGYDLPPLEVIQHTVNVDHTRAWAKGEMFLTGGSLSATRMWGEKRATVIDRCAVAAALVAAEPDEAWILWVDTDEEADHLMAALPAGLAVEVRGSDKPEAKEAKLKAFTTGQARYIVTKAKIAGFGLNWQHCARMAFVGLTYSFEKFYQALRRCYRFGQLRPVIAHLIVAETESNILSIVSAKQDQHRAMQVKMTAAMREVGLLAARGQHLRPYDAPHTMQLPAWLRTKEEQSDVFAY